MAALFTGLPRLTFHSGDSPKRVSLAAGLVHAAILFVSGQQRFMLSRGDGRIVQKIGEQAIPATKAWGNFNRFAGKATRCPRRFGICFR